MGDVKLAAVLGWYLGGSLIWFDIVVSLSLAALLFDRTADPQKTEHEGFQFLLLRFFLWERS